MNIDIERLKHDREYWDEVAPEGATHYAERDGMLVAGWYKPKNNSEYYFMRCMHDRWFLGSEFDNRHTIPRPAKQWSGDGLPPVGATEKDFCPTTAVSASLANGGNYKCEVLAHRNDMAVVMVSAPYGDSLHFVKQQHCDPLKSEKDRVVEYWCGRLAGGNSNTVIRRTLESVYDAGALKMPEDK